jgi:hypothetical protein
VKWSILYSDSDVLPGRRRMKLIDSEQQVWKVENIRIVVRADENDEVEGYDSKNAAIENWTTRAFLENRIVPRVGGRKVVVIKGDRQKSHGGVKLHIFENLTLRNSWGAFTRKSA